MIIPIGMITLWAGAIVDIPDNWALCDGNNGTPDLRDQFVVGAGDTYAVDASGGAVNHTHTFTTNGHNHSIQAGAVIAGGANIAATTDTKTDSGTTDNGSSLPPYYALAYIMKYQAP